MIKTETICEALERYGPHARVRAPYSLTIDSHPVGDYSALDVAISRLRELEGKVKQLEEQQERTLAAGDRLWRSCPDAKAALESLLAYISQDIQQRKGT